MAKEALRVVRRRGELDIKWKELVVVCFKTVFHILLEKLGKNEKEACLSVCRTIQGDSVGATATYGAHF
jgi:hypothetical protein